jgi:very-short-patch-repair endonuclease
MLGFPQLQGLFPAESAAGQADRMVNEVIARQSGVISRAQALAFGITDTVLRRRVNTGRWQRPYTQIYVTYSGPLSRDSWLWAAVLRCGPGTVLSHETAAELEGLLDGPARRSDRDIHLTVPTSRRVVPPPRVKRYYSNRVEEMRHPVREPPRTRVEETVVDLTQSARTLDDAMSWIARACGSRCTTAARIAAALAARPKLRWRTELRLAVDDAEKGAHSSLEMRYIRDIERAHRLPTAQRQVSVRRDGRRQFKDAEYEAYGVVVEIDGRASHPDDQRWRDLRRDNAVVADGGAPLRYGTADLTDRPCQVAAQLAQVLRFRGWTGTPVRCGPSCEL